MDLVEIPLEILTFCAENILLNTCHPTERRHGRCYYQLLIHMRIECYDASQAMNLVITHICRFHEQQQQQKKIIPGSTENPS